MSGASATVEFSATDAGVLRVIQRVEQQFGKLDRKIDRVEQSSRKASQSGADGFAKFGGQLKSVGLSLVGGGGILTGLELISNANKRVLEEAKEIAQAYDEAARKFMIQANLTELEAPKYQKRIDEQALANAVDPIQASAAARQLVSSGFSREEGTGEALNAFLDTMAAMNKNGEDPTPYAAGMAGFLQSQGMELTGKNVQKVGAGVHALFKDTNLQLDDLPALAREGAALRSAMPWEETFAAQSVLRDKSMESGAASTSLRNVTGRLQTAGSDKAKTEALASIGLKPGDVDFAGEDLPTVLGRLADALEGSDAPTRAGVMKGLVGEESRSALELLIAGREQIAERVRKERGGPAAFERDAKIAQSGINAAGRRLEAEKDLRVMESYAGDDLIQAAFEEEYAERGLSPFRRWTLGQMYGAARGMNYSPSTAGTAGGGMNAAGFEQFPGITADVIKRVSGAAGGVGSDAKTLNELAEAINRNTRVLEEQNQRNGGAEPAAKGRVQQVEIVGDRRPGEPRAAGLGARR